METKVYTEKKEKVIDFLIGFFGIPFCLMVAAVLINFIAVSISPSDFSYKVYTAGRFTAILFSSIALVLMLTAVLLIIYFIRYRRFIALGLLYAVVGVPLILFGTCTLIFLGGGLISAVHH